MGMPDPDRKAARGGARTDLPSSLPHHLRTLAVGLVAGVGGLLVLFRDQLAGGFAMPEALRIPYLLSVGVLEGLVGGVVGISGGPILAPLFVLGLGMAQQLAQGCARPSACC